MKNDLSLAIIGGGPAGLAAACAAKEAGIDDIVIFEKEEHLGGILNQCIHNGFGLHTFKEELTGPEYAHRFIEKVKKLNIPYKLNTTVLNITNEKEIAYINSEEGSKTLKCKAIILAMGCRERPRGAINIPGSRCAGIFTAGTAQNFVNLKGYLPGKNVVILGSGDIGLIMARRMTLEGAKVHSVIELMPYSNGLKRNIVQCLEDYNIPLLLSHTITEIHGKERLEWLTVCEVDKNLTPIKETSKEIKCDTLLLSVGLIPDNSLSLKCNVSLSKITGGALVNESMETNIEGIFSCGNVLHVHDLVDHVTEEGEKAGISSAKYINNSFKKSKNIINIFGNQGVRYTVPSTLSLENIEKFLDISFRVDKVYKNVSVAVYFDYSRVLSFKKEVLLPAEMEYIKIPLKLLNETEAIENITLKIEEE